MARHKIEEHLSEYDESVLNSFVHDPIRTASLDPRLKRIASHGHNVN